MLHVNIPYSEWIALQSFYQSTNGQHWRYKTFHPNTSLTHWNFTHYPTNNPCYDQWAGIVCTCHHYPHNHYYSGTYGYYSYSYYQTDPLLVSNCNIQKLVLEKYNLTGFITSQMGNLKNLTIIRLYNNYIVGSLPTELGQLGNIKMIGLSNNALTGIIPSTIGNLRHLKYLYLGSNYLTGSVPSSLGNLNLLQGIGLASNSLTGTIPSSLGKLNKLQIIYLNSSFLTGTIPPSLGNLNQLEYIYLDSSLLSGSIPPSLVNLEKVVNIDLSSNSLTGTIPVSVNCTLQSIVIYSNSLTGKIPSSLMNNPLYIIDFHSNFLIGSIQSSIKYLSQLQKLKLNSNFLSGDIPSAIGDLQKLQYLDLDLNNLSGNIPSTISKLSSLIILVLYSNKLQGSILNIFNATLQTNLEIILINRNQLTGSLSAEMFKLPNLETIDASRNCFSGDIPYPTICQSKTLTTLILDGLHTAISCRKKIFYGSITDSSAYTSSSNMFNKFDYCVFTIPSLATLHVSGNGFVQMLPANLNITPSLVDITLSHNLFSGYLPNSLQLKKWVSLDLSFNRITGELSSGFSSQNSNSSISLQENRLSGNFPLSLLYMTNINVLSGNIFGCDLTKSNIPPNDINISNYSCGSDGFNTPYYLWLGMVFCLFGYFFIWKFISGRAVARHTNKNRKLIYLYFQDTLGYNIQRFKNKLNSIVEIVYCNNIVMMTENLYAFINVLFWLMIFIITVLLTIYTTNGFFYEIYSYQFAWSVSVAFQSGFVAFGITFLGLFLLVSLLMILFTRNHLYSTISLKNTKTTTQSQSINQNDQSNLGSLSVSFSWTITSIANAAFVGGVNFLYVYLYLHVSSEAIFFLQILLALFRSFWDFAGYQYLSRVINSRFNVDYMSLRHTSLQLFVRLLNNIIIPCVVVAVINPDCFYNLVVAAPPVETSYQYKVCLAYHDSSGVCKDSFYQTQSTSFDPPFVYSYQCSSRFITYYSTAFVFTCMIDGFFLPLTQLFGVKLFNYGLRNNKNRLINILLYVMPNILRTDLVKKNKKTVRDKFDPFFESLELFLSNFTYLGYIMTFGAVFPPLAASFFVTVYLMNSFSLFKIERFISYTNEDTRSLYIKIINEECEGCFNDHAVMRSVWMIIIISSLFYSLFLFDTLGAAIGVNEAFWVLILMPLVPLIIYLAYKVIIRFCSNGYNNNNNNNNEINNNESNNINVESQSQFELVTITENPIIVTKISNENENA